MAPDEVKIHAGPMNYSINASTDKGVFVFYPPGLDVNHALPSMALLKKAGEITCKPPSDTIAPYFYADGPSNCAFMEIEEGTSLYGTGEVAGPLLRNGRIISLWNTGNLCYKKDGGRRLYQSHP